MDDIVSAIYDSNTVVIMFGNGQGGFTPGPQLKTGAGPASVSAGTTLAMIHTCRTLHKSLYRRLNRCL